MTEQELHDQVTRRWSALKGERSSWLSQWMDISDYIAPYIGRYSLSDRNKGQRRNTQIYDDTATQALGSLGAGLQAGVSNPSMPWFKLGTTDPDLKEAHNVKVWLSDVTDLMRQIFSQSNTYRVLHGMYEELGGFGTGCAIMLPDFKNVVHQYPFTVGEYALSADEKGDIDTVYREVQLTVAQMVSKFGYKNCSDAVRRLYNENNRDAWVTILHAIEPRKQRDEGKKGAKDMPWRSIYIEPGSSKVLKESGFKQFRGLCPRWRTNGRDIYGYGQGMQAIGNVQQLQFDQIRKSKGIDYQTDPPLQAPTSYKHADIDTLPGGMSYVDTPNAQGGIRNAMNVQFDLQYLLEDIADIRQRIHTAFYTDLFRMLANHTSPQMTATEIMERQEEKMMMLGPVLERLHNELLKPLVENTFATMVEVGILPPPPQELQGQELSIEYISLLAQAQKASGTHNIDRYMSAIGMVAEYKPEVLDKVDADTWADVYADKMGVDPDIIVPGPQVAYIRKQRAQQQQQQQKMDAMQQAASAAKDLGSVDTRQPNALTDTVSALTQ